MPSLGKQEEFDPASTNINRYLERLEQYFIANSVPADTGERFKRRATLISVIGSKVYDVLSDLCSPEAPSEKSYDDLATTLKDHFAPKNHTDFTNAFNSKEKAFPRSLTSANTSLLPATSAHKEIRKKLLSEEHNFDEALKKTLGAEAAEKDVPAFSQQDASHATPGKQARLTWLPTL